MADIDQKLGRDETVLRDTECREMLYMCISSYMDSVAHC